MCMVSMLECGVVGRGEKVREQLLEAGGCSRHSGLNYNKNIKESTVK